MKSRERGGFCGRHGESHDLAAIAAAGKMLKNMVALASRQRVLGECGEQIGIGMRLCSGRRRPLQSGLHDFWNIRHLTSVSSFSLLVSRLQPRP
jgi:hypothetical protein